MTQSAFDTIVAYHQATKHHLHRYARSAGYMDWNNQPDPFRTYDGAERIDLPLAERVQGPSFQGLFGASDAPPRPLTVDGLSAFMQHALGLSAWKVSGAGKWALRINPSSGNLHPTESHLILGPLKGMAGGVFHYAPLQHALERRARLSDAQWQRLTDHFQGPGFLVALTSIFWRESWKYGERAFRYCSLDMGHALAALSFSARLHHCRLTCITGAADAQIGTLLGFDRTHWHPLEEEVPEALCWVSADLAAPPAARRLPDGLVRMFGTLSFNGRPVPLSRQPVDWPIIAEAARAAEKPPTGPEAVDSVEAPMDKPLARGDLPALEIIGSRRSAVRFDPRRSRISREGFRSMLALTLPREGLPPFDAGVMPPAVDLLLFAHRVVDLPAGLYLLNRAPGRLAALRRAWRNDLEWEPVWPGFPLYRLLQADLTFEAMEASCHQDIAAHGAFAVAMLAAFEALVRPAPYRYRHLHWECGMIGQVLYLAAEAQNLRGTGIGCFFDDLVHEMVGIEDLSTQTLYHFTVGHPVEDQRLTTLPGYHHRSGA